jgi:hypothetical protein
MEQGIIIRNSLIAAGLHLLADNNSHGSFLALNRKPPMKYTVI